MTASRVGDTFYQDGDVARNIISTKQAVEELLVDMKSKMYHWHGTGNKMVDDYRDLLTKEEK